MIAMTEYIIETENLVKHYRDVVALNGLNMRVKKGIHGFIGPNGAGKTTTIKILLNHIFPTAGNAYVFGHDVVKDTQKIRHRVGVLLERFSIPGDMTAISYLKFTARLYNLPTNDAEHRIRGLLDLLELSNVANREFGTFSAGMKRKLGFAAALISNPELVILDEPTANIDPASRMKIREVIRDYYKEFGTSFFISSHILTELERICNTYSIIHQGTIIGEGTLEELKGKTSKSTYQIRVSDTRKLIDFLSTKEYVDELYNDELIITVIVNDTELFQTDLFSFLSSERLQLKLFHSIDDDLENIFKHLIKVKGA